MATAANTREHSSSAESVPQLLKDLRDETTHLLRQEVALAKQEMSETVAKVGRNSGYLVAGGMMAYAGATVLLFAVAAGVYALLVELGVDNMLSGFLALLIVGLAVMLIGYGLVKKAITTLSHTSLVPQRTMETLQEDKAWVKEKVSS